MRNSELTSQATTTESDISTLVAKARTAQHAAAAMNQGEIDDVVRAIAWACGNKEDASALANLSWEEAGVGNVPDRTLKIQRKALLMMRDLSTAHSVGVLPRDDMEGVVQIAKPVGVVACLCPSTHPVMDLMAKAMTVVKGGNAIIASPSPKTARSTFATGERIREELKHIGAPPDLVQVVRTPTKALAAELMRMSDAVAATGSPRSVLSARVSGAPAYTGGLGNVPVIVDSSADIADAAQKIAASKSYDYGTACSAESVLIVHDSHYDAFMRQLIYEGGQVLTPDECQTLSKALWFEGRVNSEIVGRSPFEIGEIANFDVPDTTRFLMMPVTDLKGHMEFAGEKLAPIMTVTAFSAFSDAVALVRLVLGVAGRGHSCGIHTNVAARAQRLAEDADVARVIVNQAQTFAEAGSSRNGLPVTGILGCGSWQGDLTSGNVTYRDFINVTHLVSEIPERKISEEELWRGYSERFHGGVSLDQ